MDDSSEKLPTIKPVPHPDVAMQRATSRNYEWSVLRLIELSKDLPVFDLPIAHMNLDFHLWSDRSPRKIAGHFQAVQSADLSKPIILCEDGGILDGRHRVIKALVEGRPTIKAVRFIEDPYPCEVVK